MIKILLILGILLTFTNDVSSSEELHPNTSGSDLIYSDDEVILTESGFEIVPGYIPDWFWADGTPLSTNASETLNRLFRPRVPDNTPEWYWGNGEPLSPSDDIKMPKSLNFSGRIHKDNTGVSSHKNNKHARKQKKDEVLIISDHIRQNVKDEIIWTWGKVKIRMANKTIQADKIKIDNKTGEGVAKGNVILKNDDGTQLKANISRFNIKSEKGKIFQTRGRLGKKYYIKSGKLSRLSNTHYKAKSVSLTTCTGKLPDWLFEAESMDIITGDRAVFRGGVLKIRDTPILYIPAGYLPMDQKRKSGFLFPGFGSSDIEGTTLNNEYFWAIDDHSDATFRLGYRSKRGISPGIEYRYTPSQTTNGFLTGSFVDDKITGDTYWKVDAQHNQNLPNGFLFNGTLDLEGKEFNKTFNDNISLRNRRISNSYATVRKSWDSSSLEILTRFRDST
ncbi:MAG: putative LPS assembly protein LptD, partial [Nitrospinota bacterium]|nr:putative LPS assembly protein LptD [Nitrospinota bacterium]